MTRTLNVPAGVVRVAPRREGAAGRGPLSICDFCQRRTGSVFQAGAVFSEDSGSRSRGKRRRTRRRGRTASENAPRRTTSATTSVPYAVPSIFWTFAGGLDRQIAVGNFVDPRFPGPTAELHMPLCDHWVQPVEGGSAVPGLSADVAVYTAAALSGRTCAHPGRCSTRSPGHEVACAIGTYSRDSGDARRGPRCALPSNHHPGNGAQPSMCSMLSRMACMAESRSSTIFHSISMTR